LAFTRFLKAKLYGAKFSKGENYLRPYFELNSQVLRMRLDYIMYILAIFLLLTSLVPLLVEIEGVDNNTRNVLTVSAVGLAVIVFVLGYSQRPKTKAQACQQPSNALK